MRTDLADALRVLRCGLDQLLHATYVSPVMDACDAENVLFYNVGASPFAQTCSRGLRFERVFEEPPLSPWPLPKIPLHYQSYCPADISAEFQHWRRGTVVARWNLQVPTAEALKSASRVWYLMKSQLALVETEGARELPLFGLSVTIAASKGQGVNPPTLVKPLFDGVIAAFHFHNGQGTDRVADILARRLNLSVDEVARHLLSPDMAVLGERQLLWPWRDSVQWNPADERCVAGELLLNESQHSRIAIFGELFELTID